MTEYTLETLNEKFKRLQDDEILVVYWNQHAYYITDVFVEIEQIELVAAFCILHGTSKEDAQFYENHLIVIDDREQEYIAGERDFYRATLMQGIEYTYQKELIEIVHYGPDEFPLVRFYMLSLKGRK